MKYFCYDPESGITFYRTYKEAQKYILSVLEEYRDLSDEGEGWDENVDDVCCGEIKERIAKTIIKNPTETPEFDKIWKFGLIKQN